MSAYAVPIDWRRWRAYEAINAIVQGHNEDPNIDYAKYAEIFEWDEDETTALFHQVADEMGVTIQDQPA